MSAVQASSPDSCPASPRSGILPQLYIVLLVAFCAFDLAVLNRFADACDAHNLWLLAVACGLVLWSLTSEQLPGSSANLRYGFTLLALCAAWRACGAMAPLPRLNQATLAIEDYAAATLAVVHPRQRPWSSRGYALLYTLSLPTETLLQRSLGYGLQHAP